jgi:hypothetical protein
MNKKNSMNNIIIVTVYTVLFVSVFREQIPPLPIV